jgi:hypothetical protein
MIQYKLIKEYPGSPKLGTIEFNDYKISEPYVRHSAEWKGIYFYDKHSEFWEKVEELDYEILIFRNSNSLNLVELHSNNLYCCKASGTYKGIGVQTKEQCINNEFLYIFSVKRLSDGEVFTLGDSVVENITQINERWNISEITVKFSRCFVNAVNIRNVEKLKTPLFTTEDDVEIFEGDLYSCVFSDFTITDHIANPHRKVWSEFPIKTFSKKEKAEEYVLLNKRMLLLQDLLSVWEDSDEIEIYKTSLMFKKFKELAKSKL